MPLNNKDESNCLQIECVLFFLCLLLYVHLIRFDSVDLYSIGIFRKAFAYAASLLLSHTVIVWHLCSDVNALDAPWLLTHGCHVFGRLHETQIEMIFVVIVVCFSNTHQLVAP